MKLPNSPPIVLRRVLTDSDPAFEELCRIYSASIPESERKSISALRAMIERPEYVFLVALAGPSVVGFTISICLAATDATLLEYIAVDPAHRGKGVGGVLFQETTKHPQLADRFLLMEVDSVRFPSSDSEERARRKAFYRRQRCREIDGLTYLMPRVSADEPPPMDMLVFHRELPGFIGQSKLRSWLEACYQQVYGASRNASAIDRMLSCLPDRIELR